MGGIIESKNDDPLSPTVTLIWDNGDSWYTTVAFADVTCNRRQLLTQMKGQPPTRGRRLSSEGPDGSSQSRRRQFSVLGGGRILQGSMPTCPGMGPGEFCDCGGDCGGSYCQCEAAGAADCCNDGSGGGGADYGGDDNCAVHGLGPEYASGCESGCECCRADGGCGECADDHVCEFPYGDDYGVCTSCEVRFAGDDALIEHCRNEAGAGFDHEGTRYDNSCGGGGHHGDGDGDGGFDPATAPRLERMAEYLCPCALTGFCPPFTLCDKGYPHFGQLTGYWCSLLEERCTGVLFSGRDEGAIPPRYEDRAVLATGKCKDVPAETYNDFGYVTLDEMQRCMGGACEDGSEMEWMVCAEQKGGGPGVPHGPRLLLDVDALFETDLESAEFEADVALEFMDAPVADT
jgi:hypothetical protein